MERDEARRRFDARVDIECRHRPSNARSRRRTKRRRGASSGGRERPNVTRPHASRASRVTRRGHGVSFGYSPCPSTLPRVGTRDGECFLTTTFRPRKTLKPKCTDCLLSQNRVAFGNQAEHLDGRVLITNIPRRFETPFGTSAQDRPSSILMKNAVFHLRLRQSATRNPGFRGRWFS